MARYDEALDAEESGTSLSSVNFLKNKKSSVIAQLVRRLENFRQPFACSSRLLLQLRGNPICPTEVYPLLSVFADAINDSSVYPLPKCLSRARRKAGPVSLRWFSGEMFWLEVCKMTL